MFFRAFFVYAVLALNCFNTNSALANSNSVDKASASIFIENFMDQVINAIREDSGHGYSYTNKNKFKSIARVIQPNVDYKWITSFVMNEIYSKIQESEKKLLVNAYSEYAIKNYYQYFLKFSKCTFQIKSVSKIGNEYLVSTDLICANKEGKNSNIVFRVRKDDEKFMVYDIIFDGYSILIVERSKFKAKIVGKRISFKELIYYLNNDVERSNSH